MLSESFQHEIDINRTL